MANCKMMTTAKNLDTIAKTAGTIFQIVGIVCAVFAVLVLVLGEMIFEAGSFTLDLDFVKLHLAQQYQSVTPEVKLYAVMGLLIVCVLCAAVWYICRCFRSILEPVKQGRPFAEQIPKNLRKTAWAVLIGGGLMELFGWVEKLIQAHAYPLAEIISPDAVTKIEYVFTMDFGFILIAGVLIFLSYIFEYGQQLQQQADETL